jgi:hypothetical protein
MEYIILHIDAADMFIDDDGDVSLSWEPHMEHRAPQSYSLLSQ